LLIADFRLIGLLAPNLQSAILNLQLFGLFMISVFAATATELTELKPVWRGLLILGRYVVAALTVGTLKHYVIAWHNSKS